MEYVDEVVEFIRGFFTDAQRLLNKCTKPDSKEFRKIAIATAIGFLIMGFIGFFVKLIHMPLHSLFLQQ